jgi:Kef-type K+ transport system membrane component KefB
MNLPPLPSSWKVVAFTFNLLLGLVLSQLAGACIGKHEYHILHEVVQSLTMWALSFIMVNVGYEFTIDKGDLTEYGWDYLIAMTAAGFPWLFVAFWFILVLDSIGAEEAFLVARFAAPTSAGILFSMLEVAGLKETWLFPKARMLAIFDDLDTIILMVPLKIVIIGFKWELLVVSGIMLALLGLAWFKLHKIRLPFTWYWSLTYAALVTTACKVLHVVTHYHIDMEPIHIEVLLPAFVIGCIIDTPVAREELKLQKRMSFEKKLSRQCARSFDEKALSTSKILAAANSVSSVSSSPIRCSKEAKMEQIHEEKPHFPSSECSGLSPVAMFAARAVTEDAVPAPPGCVTDEGSSSNSQDGAKVVDALQFERQESKNSNASFASELTDKSQRSSKTSSEKPRPRRDIRGLSKTSAASRMSEQSTLSRYGVEIEHGSVWEPFVQSTVSMVFMVLVGLSMPPLMGKNAEGNESNMDAGLIVLHTVAVSVLMVLGKMFPVLCYRDEASVRERFALCIGMCPRGEVGASIIVISLELGVKGPAITISMCALVINLVLSGGFIGLVKLLLNCGSDSTEVEACAECQEL